MNILPKLVSSVFIALLLCGTGYSEEYGWHFREPRTFNNWAMINVQLVQERGHVIIRGQRMSPFVVLSPSGLAIPPDFSLLELRVKVRSVNSRGRLFIKTADNRTWRQEYDFGGPGEFNIHIIDIKAISGSVAPIDSFGLGFDSGVEVELDYMKIYRPSLAHILIGHWKQFWEAGYIASWTVNTIYAPLIGNFPFLRLLHILVVVLTALIIVAFRPVNIVSIAKAFVLSSVIAGALFSMRMDYNWYMQWARDLAFLSGKRVEEIINLTGGGDAYYSAQRLKEIIPPGERVRVYAPNEYERLLIKYYSLPVKASGGGKYVLVYRDYTISFDQSRNILQKNNEVMAKDVSLVSTFGNGVTLYRAGAPNK